MFSKINSVAPETNLHNFDLSKRLQGNKRLQINLVENEMQHRENIISLFMNQCMYLTLCQNDKPSKPAAVIEQTDKKKTLSVLEVVERDHLTRGAAEDTCRMVQSVTALV